MVCSSSPQNGNELRKAARSIIAFIVVFIDLVNLPGAGSPQIETANIIVTVFPDPLPPYRWNTNGFSLMISTNGLANDAAIISRTSIVLRRSAPMRSTQADSFPLLRMVPYSYLYCSPPSN